MTNTQPTGSPLDGMILSHERQANESFEDYKNRRINNYNRLKSYKNGRVVWCSVEQYKISETLMGTRKVKGTFVGSTSNLN